MLKATKAAAAAGVMGVLAAGVASAHPTYHSQQNTLVHEIMKPGRGVSFDIGGKHAVGYFLIANRSCQLTVVVADALGGEPGKDSPGTRFVIPVSAGKSFKLDASAGQTADFFCGLGAARMIARVYDRAPYKS
jgi:hypothetical protein